MKKKISLLIALILFVACLTGVVNAETFTVKMSLTSDSYLVPGDIVVVDLKVSEINAGDGINAMSGTLEYDKNVFDEVTQNNYEGKNEWTVFLYDKTSQIFTAIRSNDVALPSDVLTITLRVKDAAAVESTTITMKDITTSGGEATGDIEVEDVKVTVKKKVETPTTEVNETVNEVVNETKNEIVNETKNEIVNETKNEIAGGNTITNSINTNKVNNDASTGKLPQTGEGIEVALGIAVISIIAIIAYSKYRNINI